MKNTVKGKSASLNRYLAKGMVVRYFIPLLLVGLLIYLRVLNLVVTPNHELWRLALGTKNNMGLWQGIKLDVLRVRGAELNYTPPNYGQEMSTANIVIDARNLVFLGSFCAQLSTLKYIETPESSEFVKQVKKKMRDGGGVKNTFYLRRIFFMDNRGSS